jgi:hypothetical protein
MLTVWLKLYHKFKNKLLGRWNTMPVMLVFMEMG